MGKESKIQWTDATVNFWHGCKKISPGCAKCYMYRGKERFNQDGSKIVRSVPATFRLPLKWKDSKKIFVCSWSDFFIKEADEWRHDALATMATAPWHTYQILTKRPERVIECLKDNQWFYVQNYFWLGVSAEDQAYFEQRVDELDRIPHTGVKFVSAEPLLGKIKLIKSDANSIDWLIVGAESGNNTGKYKYRECKLEWIEELVYDAMRLKIPVFIKQLGTHLSKELGLKDRHGGDINEWPEHLRIREFPKF